VVIMLKREGFAGENLEDYAGLAKSHPVASALMLIFMFSLTGIAPTAGFIGNFYIFMEAVYSGHIYLVIFAVLFSAVSAFFYLRVVMYMYMKEPAGEITLSYSKTIGVALAFALIMVLAIGVLPSHLLNFARNSFFG